MILLCSADPISVLNFEVASFDEDALMSFIIGSGVVVCFRLRRCDFLCCGMTYSGVIVSWLGVPCCGGAVAWRGIVWLWRA